MPPVLILLMATLVPASTGFTGENCNQIIDHCDSSPCYGTATCTSSLTGFSCQCPIDYTGELCDQQIDDCSSSPCLNGATCIDGFAKLHMQLCGRI